MRWEAEEAEAVLERIWDLHDKVSDSIHAISRAHFLRSSSTTRDDRGGAGGAGAGGYVFVKGEDSEAAAAAAMADARRLHAIRAALEDLEDQLEFFHTVQSQQQAERDAAIARLEQSRIILATRLAEHHGKRYRVIEEALAFVGEVDDKSRYVSPEDVYGTHSPSGENAKDARVHRSSIVMRMLSCSLALAKNSFRVDKIGGVLGNAAVFAVSMLAFLQLHQAALGSKNQTVHYQYRKRIENRTFRSGSSQKSGKEKQLEVLLGRG